MKTFNNFEGFADWLNKVVIETNEQAREDIARQVYKDSEEYTYIDTGEMYNSGASSDFKNGYVVIKAPQVRWLYYTPWITPRGNKNAVPQWFERTKIENMNDYINIYDNLFNKNKK